MVALTFKLSSARARFDIGAGGDEKPETDYFTWPKVIGIDMIDCTKFI